MLLLQIPLLLPRLCLLQISGYIENVSFHAFIRVCPFNFVVLQDKFSVIAVW